MAEGDQASFECAVSGEPRAEISWYLNGDAIEPRDDRVKIFSDPQTGQRGLIISPVRPEDRGNYVARASNRAGEAKSFAKLVVKVLGDFKTMTDSTTVQMEEKSVVPSFKEKFGDKFAPDGTTVKFECIVTGKPLPKVSFFLCKWKIGMN